MQQSIDELRSLARGSDGVAFIKALLNNNDNAFRPPADWKCTLTALTLIAFRTSVVCIRLTAALGGRTLA